MVNSVIFVFLPYLLSGKRSLEITVQDRDTFRPVRVLPFRKDNAELSRQKRREAPVQHKVKEKPIPHKMEIPVPASRASAPAIDYKGPAIEINPRILDGPKVEQPVLDPRAVETEPVRDQASLLQGTKVYDQSEVDQAPTVLVRKRPIYPYRAKRLGLTGQVRVKFLVDSEGRVGQIGIIRAEPEEIFDKSVIMALSTWRFAPGKVKGRPVSTWVTTTIYFRLEDNR
jgi:protein TonB